MSLLLIDQKTARVLCGCWKSRLNENTAQEALARGQVQSEIFGDCLSDVRQRSTRAQINSRFRAFAKDNQRSIFAGMVCASVRRVVSVIGGNHYEIVFFAQLIARYFLRSNPG